MAEEEKKEAEEGGEEGEEGEGGKKKGGSKLIIIIVLLLVVLGGAGGGAFFFLNHAPEGEEGEGVAAEEEVDPAVAEEAIRAQMQSVAFYEVPNIVVNLASNGGAVHYLKIKLTLELGSETDIPHIEKLMPRIIDDFQVYLRQLRMEDLQGSAGIYRLKEALLMRANQSAQPIEIQNILFTEMLIQ